MTVSEYAREATERGKYESRTPLAYRQYWLNFWFEIAEHGRPLKAQPNEFPPYTRGYGLEMIAGNWDWALHEQVAEQIVLTPAQQALLLEALLTYSG